MDAPEFDIAFDTDGFGCANRDVFLQGGEGVLVDRDETKDSWAYYSRKLAVYMIPHWCVDDPGPVRCNTACSASPREDDIGRIPFTLMPYLAHSFAAASVKPLTANFVPPYGPRFSAVR